MPGEERERTTRISPQTYGPGPGPRPVERFGLRHAAPVAFGIVLLAILQVAPAILQLDPATAPPWARVSVLLAMLELAYAAWILLVPDWATMRVAMFVTATVAILYCVALGANLSTPRFTPAPLDMQTAPGGASLWCATIACAALSLTYGSGRLSHRWRK